MKELIFDTIRVKLFVGRNVLKIVTLSDKPTDNVKMTANFILDGEYCLNEIGEYITTYLMSYIGYNNTDKLYRECFEIHQERKLKRTLKVLQTYYNLSDKVLPKAYFLLIHNSLILEKKFQSVVNESKKQILIHLFVSHTTDVDEIYKTFEKLYSPYSKVRFGVETLDSITEVRDYIKSKDSPKGNTFFRTFLKLRDEIK